jgi:hypothetical protein
MRLIRSGVIAAVAFAALAGMAQGAFAGKGGKAQAGDEALVGSWMGSFKDGSRLFFIISRRWDGGLKASYGLIESLSSGAWMDSVAFTNGKVAMVAKRSEVSFEGTLGADGKTMVGRLKVPNALKRVTLTKVDAVPGPKRPQTPKRPFPYEERQVHYRNEAAGIVLAGTLTLPREGGPFPAVLLIAGSGPSDRNEEVLFHRPFDVIADYLTRRGVAVLRVDKRGVGESGGDWPSSDVKEFAGDALAGLKFLAGLPEIDAKRMGLLGQSEGGMVAPIAAAESEEVSFAVCMAGPAMNWFDLIVLQDATEAMAAGASAEQAKLIEAWSTRYYTIVRDTPDLAEARKKLQELKAKRTPEELAAYGSIGNTGTLNIDIVLENWCRQCLRLDPGEYLARTKCPVLALFGEKDCQVPAGPNLEAAEKAFKKSGNKDAKAMSLPGVNHLFQRCGGGGTSEYSQIEETISPDVLKLVGDWIEAHTKAKQ